MKNYIIIALKALFFLYFVPAWFYRKRGQQALAQLKVKAAKDFIGFINEHESVIYTHYDEIIKVRAIVSELDAMDVELRKTRKQRKEEAHQRYIEAYKKAEIEYKKEHPGLYLDFMDWKSWDANVALMSIGVSENVEMGLAKMQAQITLNALSSIIAPAAQEDQELVCRLERFLEASLAELNFAVNQHVVWFEDKKLYQVARQTLLAFGNGQVLEKYKKVFEDLEPQLV